MNSWNRVFWKNAKSLMNRHAPILSRLKYWKTLSFAVSDFRFPGLRPCRQHGDSLEAYFNKFVRWIVHLPPRHDENAHDFCVRRNRAICKLKKEARVDVRFRWCLRVVTWMEHLFRHPDSCGFLCLEVQDSAWLRSRREHMGGTGARGTRSGPGCPARFTDSWFEPLKRSGCFDNLTRSQKQSKESANLLYTLVFA